MRVSFNSFLFFAASAMIANTVAVSHPAFIPATGRHHRRDDSDNPAVDKLSGLFNDTLDSLQSLQNAQVIPVLLAEIVTGLDILGLTPDDDSAGDANTKRDLKDLVTRQNDASLNVSAVVGDLQAGLAAALDLSNETSSALQNLTTLIPELQAALASFGFNITSASDD